jgi:extracellular factor (EF) 3-hydroxypalmitic acid methyl ester biosynthesis protein
MENLLNWHLIYRNESQMRDICPEAADQSDMCVRADATGVNLFLEVRKPKNG